MRLRTVFFLPLVALVWHCGSSSSSTSPGLDAGTPPTPPPGTPGDDGGGSCTANAACTTNPGAACRTGVTSCTSGATSCVDGPPVADGTTCASGVCTRGACLGSAMVTSSVDLSQASVTQGRTCAAEAPSFSVTALTATTATLGAAPAGDCLAAGDEALLVNLQGTSTSTSSVGNWELLSVASVSGTTVTFASAKTKTYGASGDTPIGTGATDQKVALVRVPQFGTLTVAAGGTLTTSAWNGTTGGVLALRAAKLTVAGTITAAALGYRGGQWSRDDASCDDSVQTETGESIGGPGIAQLTASNGGPGGIGPGGGISFISSAPQNAGAGHAGAGEAGSDGNGRTVGDPGGSYGANDASKLTMGSGSSGNLTCANGFPGPALVDVNERLAGGIIAIFASTLEVQAGGSITATAAPSSRNVSASGGYVFLMGTTLTLGDGLVTAAGGVAIAQDGAAPVKSSDGYVVVKAATVSGTTTPAANKL